MQIYHIFPRSIQLKNALLFWSGLYDVLEEGEFFWSYECLLPPYRGWNGGNHPKNPDENCVTMDTSGFWDDANCSSSSVAGYICETTTRGWYDQDFVVRASCNTWKTLHRIWAFILKSHTKIWTVYINLLACLPDQVSTEWLVVFF